MRTKLTAFFSFMLILLVCACVPTEKYKTNEVYHGFKLLEKRFVKEVNANCLYFEHVKTGARLFKIDAEDENKTFAINFKTLPDNSCGTPHILEHSVLEGSKNFPVKSPFMALAKGSLNTFLNASTGSDITSYPIASMNTKDYYNLMHVYLDAVFNPRVYDDPRIFKQEGWHYELADKESDVVYKGVVYNEMKGAFSSPFRSLFYHVSKNLFPDNTYGVSSGGYPEAIPDLTYEAFIDFHKTYYHPSNSYIFLYGDADLNRELEFINANYLSNYEKSDKKIEIPLQQPFEQMKEVEETYAVSQGSSIKNQTFLNLSFVAGLGTDQAQNLAFDVLAEALVNHEAAPLRLAIQEAGLSQNIFANYREQKQNVFSITVQNTNPEDKEKFKDVVFETFKKVAREGLDKTTVEGIINRMEFNLKEGNTPDKGVRYNGIISNNWLYGNNPFKGLEFEQPLAEVKKALTTNMLESLIEKHLLPNPHSLLMVLKPEPGLQQKIDARAKKKLAEFKQQLSDEEIGQLIKETKELEAYQKEEDTPEALSTIPMLNISDISKEVEWYGIEEKNVAGLPVLHHNTFTNDIIYADLYFDMRVLPQELIPYASLLSAIMKQLNTENYTYGELDNAFNINTGGFFTYLNTFLKDRSDDQLIPKFVVSGKVTTDKIDKLFELAGELMYKLKLDDKERLKMVLTRHQAGYDAFIKQDGRSFARRRLASYYSNEGIFDEKTGGMDYYHFITGLVDNFDANSDEVIEKLQQTASLLFVKNNMTAAVTSSNENIPAYSKGLETLANMLSEEEPKQVEWKFDFEQKNEGLLTASKVQYVYKGYNLKKLGYEWNGKIRVLQNALSINWLYNQIRVIGGAYGGYCVFSSNGDAYFASYRDPNLKETIENYDNSPDYLENFEADEKEMTRLIIGTISGMDQPLTPQGKGRRAIQYYFENRTIDQLKAEREEVLATTAQDIKDMKKMVSDVLAQDVLCVYGNEDKLKSNEEVFKNLVKVTK